MKLFSKFRKRMEEWETECLEQQHKDPKNTQIIYLDFDQMNELMTKGAVEVEGLAEPIYIEEFFKNKKDAN